MPMTMPMKSKRAATVTPRRGEPVEHFQAGRLELRRSEPVARPIRIGQASDPRALLGSVVEPHNR